MSREEPNQPRGGESLRASTSEISTCQLLQTDTH